MWCLEVELAEAAEALDVVNKGGEVSRFLAGATGCARRCHSLRWRRGRGQAGRRVQELNFDYVE